jgi:hypothetical protein
MKKILLLLGIVFLLAACEETNEEKTPTSQSLTTIKEWPTIDFKEHYTIQVPADFTGPGFDHFFEGNTFHKESADGKIILESYYGTWAYKYDFGMVLPDSIPAQDQVKNSKGEKIYLDFRESFCNKDEIVGYLYYSQWQVCNGQLYWKVDGKFQAALVVEFPYSELGTINKIISTIKVKQTVVND